MTYSEEDSKTSGRGQPQGDDISDIEHLLDDQSTSEFRKANLMSISDTILKLTIPLHRPQGQASKAGRRSGEATLSLAAGEHETVAQ